MQIQTLTLDMPLHPRDISGFRAAIVELVGREQEAFHNHDNTEGKPHYHWDYPLIQYKVQAGKATITAMGQGRELINQHLLPNIPDVLHFAGETHEIQGFQIQKQNYNWSLHASPQPYGIMHWLGLNADNYKAWKSATREDVKQVILDKALTGHLRAFAKAADLSFVAQIEGEVIKIHRTKAMNWHGQTFIGFNAIIGSNLSLPHSIGLGRCTAFGFGEVQPLEVYQRNINRKKRRRPRLQEA